MNWNRIAQHARCYGNPNKKKVIRKRKKRKANRELKQEYRPKTNDKIKAFYASFEWRKLRYATLLRYGRKCMCCRTEKGVMHVDHIKPIRRNWDLRLDPENVQVLCEACNHGKGNWDETDLREQKEDINFIDEDTELRLKLIKEQLGYNSH